MIALDIAEHFKATIRPNGFKAQVVAPSRAAALRYAEHLNNFGLSAYPIITRQSQRRAGVQRGARSQPRASHQRVRRP